MPAVAVPPSLVLPPVLRRKSWLKSTCAAKALLALPAAISLGITLAPSAHAQPVTVITTNKSSTVILSNTANYKVPLTLSAYRTISTSGIGVSGNASKLWDFHNFGTVISSDSYAVDIVGGEIWDKYRASTISVMYGAIGGVLISGTTQAFVTNGAHGTITGGTFGVELVSPEAFLANSGIIRGNNTSNSTGAYLENGGYAINHSRSTISGFLYGLEIKNGAGNVTNNGSINSQGDGILLGSQAGTLINNGKISQTGSNSSDAAVKMFGGYLENFGTSFYSPPVEFISGYANGVITYGTVTNILNKGTIRGTGTFGNGADGIILGAGGTITNHSGTRATAMIFGAGDAIDVTNGGTVFNDSGTIKGLHDGITMAAGGFVSNAATATIYGGNFGIHTSGTLATVLNSGTITGHTSIGVDLQAGGFVSNASTGTIFGGWDAVAITGAAGTVENAGQIAGPGNLGVYLNDGGAVTNAAGGLITSNKGGIQIEGALGYVLNQGTIAAVKWDGVHLVNGGSVVNAGTGASITGTEAGVLIGYAHDTAANYGQVTNSGYIGGGTAGVALFGTLAGLGSGVVVNSGTIVATLVPGAGVYLYHGGAVTNASGGIIKGAAGVGARTGFASVDNAGSITGAAYGVELAAGGLVSNAATASIYGGNFGIYTRGTLGTVANSGSITGHTTAGVNLHNGGFVSNASTGTIYGGTTGVEITGALASVTNAGSIGGRHEGVDLEAASNTLVNSGSITADIFQVVFISGSIASVVNDSGGRIIADDSGNYDNNGIYAESDQFSLDNAGSIYAYANGVFLSSGITAGVTNELTGTITGGHRGIYSEALSLGLTNSGLITGSDYGIHAGGTISSITNQSTGTIIGGTIGVDINSGFGTVINAGHITGTAVAGVQLNAGYVSNSGFITGGTYGVDVLNALGTVFNTGSITGTALAGVWLGGGGYVNNTFANDPNIGTISGGSFGVYAGGTLGTVANLGLITGSSIGVTLNQGGTINNGSFTIGSNHYYGTIYGGQTGVDVANAPGTVLNAGTITGHTSIGVDLSAGGFVSDASTGAITGGSYGAYFAGAYGTLQNAGTIIAGSIGVDFAAGGTANNSGTIITTLASSVGIQANSLSSVTNSGLIYGALGSTGIVLNQGGYVNNSGTIDHLDRVGVAVYNAAGTVNNSKSIIGLARGVGLYDGGRLINSGSIYGGSGGAYAGNEFATVINSGSITGKSGNGLWLEAGGYVSNLSTASIYGGNQGVLLNSTFSTVINSGSITGTSKAGVWLGAGGYVNNTFANDPDIGTISGGSFGVYADITLGTVANLGLITGGSIGVKLNHGGTINNGSFTIGSNHYFGTIYGGQTGVDVDNALGTVVNAGSIIAGGTNGVGVYLQDGGSVLNSGHILSTLGTGARLEDSAYLTNASGGTITGYTIGAALYGTFSAVINSGLINATNSAGTGVLMADLGDVGNSFSGVILGGSLGAGVYLQNGGYAGNVGRITGGYGIKAANTASAVFNFGSIGGDTAGVALLAGGEVINPVITVSGSSYVGVISGGTTGVYIGGSSFGLVFNEGTITGRGTMLGGYGVELNNGGTVLNLPGTLFAGSIYGHIGVGVNNTLGAVLNAGSIGGEYAGARLQDGGIIKNITYGNGTGTISGGYIGVQAFSTFGNSIINSGVIIGTGGVGVELAYGTLNNEAGGVIRGGHYGVVASDATITNAGLITDSPLTNHAGVLIYGTSSLANLATGTISGETGVIIAGDSDTLFNAGTIIGSGGTAIAIVDFPDPAQITLTTGSTLFGAIDGGGTDGQITLTGTNIMDSNIVNFGTGSALSIVPGADWTASGNWTIAAVTNSGTFQPGIIGTPLNLTGNFVQGSLGTLRVVVAPSVTSQFNITGTAALAGKLTYVFAPGFYHSGTFEFFSATGGVTGGFDSVTYNGDVPAGLTHSTSSEVSSANLVLTGSAYVNPEDGSLFSDMNQEAAGQAQVANDSLLGKAAEGGGAGSPEACAAAEAVNQAGNAPGSTASQMATALGNAFCTAGGWIQATGEAASMNASGAAPSFNAAGGGFLAGIDRPVDSAGTRIGLAVGYDTTWLHDSAGGKGSMDTTRVGLYGSQPIGSFTLAADFLYGNASNTSTRQTGIGGLGAKYSGNIYSGGVQLSTGMAMDDFDIEPSAGAKFASVNTDSLNESATGVEALFAVKGAASSYTSVQPFVNLGVSRSFLTGAAITVTPEASVGYILEAGDRGKAVALTVADGTNFTSSHSNPDSSAAQLSAGIAAGKNNWSLYARYSAYLSGNWTAQTGEAGLEVRF